MNIVSSGKNVLERANPRGWILLDKPQGMTSTHVGGLLKQALRPHFGRVKHLGHVGTLDPLATGVLVLALGEATKLIPYLERNESIWGTVSNPQERPRKTYEFDVKFGQETDSYDADGRVVATTAHLPTKDDLLNVLPRFQGAQSQRPPVYSALKQGGHKLCELARKGQSVTVSARPVWIEALTLADFQPPVARFLAEVSQGTYIRSLGRDLAEASGSLGHIIRLRRLRDGPFRVENALGLPEILGLLDRERPEDVIIPLEDVLGGIPAVSVRDDAWKVLKNGCPWTVPSENESPAVRIRFHDRLVGMGRVTGGICYPRRLLSV